MENKQIIYLDKVGVKVVFDVLDGVVLFHIAERTVDVPVDFDLPFLEPRPHLFAL